MFDEFDKEEDNWHPKIPKYRRVIKKTAGIMFTVFAFGIIALMVVRLVMSKPPSSMKEMVWTDITAAAYNEHGEKFKVSHILCTDSFSENNMFSVDTITFCETASQLQVTLRYNDRSMAYLLEDYPDAESYDETYSFVLRENNGAIYTSCSYTSDKRMGYTYRHIIFDGVSLKDVSAAYLDVYFSGDFDTSKKALHTMYVYRYDFAVQDYPIGTPEVGKYEIKTQIK